MIPIETTYIIITISAIVGVIAALVFIAIKENLDR